MGWVDDKFKERLAINSGTSMLWNALRDSIGFCAEEYNDRVKGTEDQLYRADCKASSPLCHRIEKRGATPQAIEIFIDAEEPLLKTLSQPSGTVKTICAYRVKSDKSGVEFFESKADGATEAIHPSVACEMALSEFFFKPFPTQFTSRL